MRAICNVTYYVRCTYTIHTVFNSGRSNIEANCSAPGETRIDYVQRKEASGIGSMQCMRDGSLIIHLHQLNMAKVNAILKPGRSIQKQFVAVILKTKECLNSFEFVGVCPFPPLNASNVAMGQPQSTLMPATNALARCTIFHSCFTMS